MSSTVRIPKSKALNFKKLSFLYLIFIVFYFSSTSGEYVRQYINLEKTQKRLNEHLVSQLTEIDSNDKRSLLIKKEALEAIEQIKRLEESHEKYMVNVINSDEELKETKFVSSLEEMGINIDSIDVILRNFVNTLPDEERKKTEIDLGLVGDKVSSLNSKQNTFVKGTPTGVFGSIIQHYKTVVLSSALDGIQKSMSKKIKIQTVNKKDSSFLIGFNNTFNFGELVRFNFLSPQNKMPEVIIDEKNLKFCKIKTRSFM